MTAFLALGSVEASSLLRRRLRGFDNHKVVRLDTVGDGWLSKGLKIAQGNLALVCNILTGASVIRLLEYLTHLRLVFFSGNFDLHWPLVGLSWKGSSGSLKQGLGGGMGRGLRHLLSGFQAPVPGVRGLNPLPARSPGGVGHRTWENLEGCRRLANGQEVQWAEEDSCGVWVFPGLSMWHYPLLPTPARSRNPSCWEGFQQTAEEGCFTDGGRQGDSFRTQTQSQV